MQKCSSNAISAKHLSFLQGTTVTVDTSIYLYKYLGEFERGPNRLADRFTQLIGVFKMYNITPIFIFDGPPPPEKMAVLLQRSIQKNKAELKYNQILQNSIHSSASHETLTEETRTLLLDLQRQFIRIKDADIEHMQTIMTDNQIDYRISSEEADQMCVQLVKMRKASGTVSDDMDMFSYGCEQVLRILDVDTHMIMVYDTKCIADELNMSMELFRETVILSCTDYNANMSNITTIGESVKWAHRYMEYCQSIKNNKMINKAVLSFYEWLQKNTKYITDYPKLIRVYKRFS